MGRKSDEQILTEMLELIDGTHWTKKKLSCPVFPTKRMKVKDRRKNNPNPSGYRMVDVPDYSQPPVKTTYCIVGLAMKVLDLEPTIIVRNKQLYHALLEHGINTIGKEEEDIPNTYVSLFKRLSNEIPDSKIVEEMVENVSYISHYERLGHYAFFIEKYNDLPATEKADIRAMIERARDKATKGSVSAKKDKAV